MTKRYLLNVFAIALLSGIFSLKGFSQDCEYEFSLGNDTVLNCGSSITLTAPEGFEYDWSTNSSNQSITVSQPGVYSVNLIEQESSEVQNGDFSDGYSGFTSSYIVGTGGTFGLLSSEGTYAIAANADETHDNFVDCFDHTSGDATGSMMVVNGASTAGQEIWSQTVTVTPNSTYIFSVWGMSVVGSNPGQLNFSINGNQIGETFELPAVTCEWSQFYVTWESGPNTDADISIVNQNISPSGNDFAIDDISFAPVCIYTDSIEVSQPPIPQLTVSENQTICAGDSVILTASSSVPGSTFLWQPGAIQGSEITVSPESNNLYSVIATSPQNCNSAQGSVIVSVEDSPELMLTGNDTICPGESTTFNVESDFANMSYTWSPGDLEGDEVTLSPESTTTYTVFGESGSGCNAEMDFTVVVQTPPSVSIDGSNSICEGDDALLIASSTTPNVDFEWSNSETTDQIVVSPSSSTEYSVTAFDGFCTSEPATFSVDVNPVPELYAPSDTLICPGSSASLSAQSDQSGATFGWSPGNLTGSSVVVSPADATIYTVVAAVGNCVSEPQSFLIDFIPSCNCVFEMPNIFTPNDDNYNNEFTRIGGQDCLFTEYDLRIFNRWGKEVWSTSNPTAAWDGKRKDNDMPEGVYYWTVKYSFIGGDNSSEKSMSGYITLVR
ncbi:T9SS type B sorting domain-containing protein [Halocola ammonii]